MAGASAIPGVWGNMMTFLGKQKQLQNRVDKTPNSDNVRFGWSM